MKYLPILILVLLFSCQSGQEKKTISDLKTDQIEVLIIGTFYFSNFNPQNINSEDQTHEVDVLSLQNQKELEIISDKIAKFKPDKIFVEYPFQNQNKLDSMYQNVIPGDYSKLKRGEIIQLAFRIAKKLNQSKVYGFGYESGSFPYDEMIATMKKANQSALLKKEEEDFKAYVKRYNAVVDSTQSVTEVLYFLNDQKNRSEDLGWYLNSANMAGLENDTVGTFLTSEWYRRNLMMYSIIQKKVTKEDNRIMILAGAGHIDIIKDFIEKNPTWKLIELKEL